MRILYYLPLLLIAAWNHPLCAQWANPGNPTGLPRHLLNPADPETAPIWIGYAALAGMDRASRTTNLFAMHRNLTYRLRQPDVLVQVRRKVRYFAGKERIKNGFV